MKPIPFQNVPIVKLYYTGCPFEKYSLDGVKHATEVRVHRHQSEVEGRRRRTCPVTRGRLARTQVETGFAAREAFREVP